MTDLELANNSSNVLKSNSKNPVSNYRTKSMSDDVESISFNNRCGLFAWRPKCLQRFRSIYLFLLTMCLVCIIQTALSAGYMSSQITTLERRFSLDSYMLGVIQSFFDVGFIASVVFVGFFGGQGRIPLWIGCGMLIMSLGAFSFAVPEFITTFQATQNVGYESVPVCHSRGSGNYSINGNSSDTADCVSGNRANWLVKLLFIIGQVLIGCGSSPVLSLGPTYIDDHVIPTVAPPLIALLYASSALGPVFGFGLGATMLKYPVSGKLSPGSRPGDLDWIGAWWGGYACLGICGAIMAIFLFMFPKQVRKLRQAKPMNSFLCFSKMKQKDNSNVDGTNNMKITKNDYQTAPTREPLMKIKTDNLTEKSKSLGSSAPELQSEVSRQMSNASIAKEYGKNLKDIPGAILSLLKNKVYIVVSLAICCEMFLVNGFAAFLPKYIENEYKVSNITSSLIAGGLIVPSGALGIIVGGIIMHRFQMSRRRATLFSIVAVLAVLICLVLFFITGCQNPPFAGKNTPNYFESENYTSIDGKCNTKYCANKCNSNLFHPVCDLENGVTYFSACHAGCQNFSPSNTNPKESFYNCSCSATSLNYMNPPQKLVAGECPLKCNSLVTFVLFLTMALFLTGVTQNPLLMVTMRSVQKHERAFALGFQFVILRLLAYIPSPIIYGSVIDAACIHWKRNCGDRGDCLVTDLKLLNQYLIGLSFAVKVGAAAFYIILFFILPKHHHIMNPDSFSATDEAIRDDDMIEPKESADKNITQISLNNQDL